jgi:glycosyltransferase involved in cell wall biosynthesis
VHDDPLVVKCCAHNWNGSHQDMSPQMRICLSMIVKNESAVIERCLRSVHPHIHAWAVVDTGSSDETQALVRRTLADLPGTLIERPWVDFSESRNQALELARHYGDYALIIDADDVLEVDPDFVWNKLDQAAYMLQVVDAGDTHYWRVALPKLDAGWTWRGVLHEALHAPHRVSTPHLTGLRILRIFNDGARSQRSRTEKFLHDADVLRQALIDDPDNARYEFYFAQSLRDAGQWPEAIVAYEKRVSMGGWAEEVYYAKFQIAMLKERVGAAYPEIVAAYLDAYDFRPTRAEAPCQLARYCRLQKRYSIARNFAHIASTMPCSDDVLFIDRAVHEWRARDELAVAAYWCGEHELSARLCRELLADPRLPGSERARVARNLEFAEAVPGARA